jgi:hypothetical protein
MTAHLTAARPADATRVDANGTMWRLRALAAMGHDATRIARALGSRPDLIRRLLSGREAAVTAALRGEVAALLDAWWDKTPPRDTTARRRTAARAGAAVAATSDLSTRRDVRDRRLWRTCDHAEETRRCRAEDPVRRGAQSHCGIRGRADSHAPRQRAKALMLAGPPRSSRIVP